jgi:hypothetical protein
MPSIFALELIFSLLVVIIAGGWTLLDLHTRYPCKPHLIAFEDAELAVKRAAQHGGRRLTR